MRINGSFLACTMFLANAFGLPAATNERQVSVQDLYDGHLRPDIQVDTFRHIDKLFPSRTVPRGGPAYPLPRNSKGLQNLRFVSEGRSCDLYDYLSLNRVGGVLVLKEGRIVLEDYELGNTEQTRWVSWSLVKSITSTLVGAAIRDGSIGSLDDPVTKYLPQLRGGGYDGASIRNVLQMASGVAWDETYTDPSSDRRRMLDLQIAQKSGLILQFMAGLHRAAAPGTRWNYSTGETYLVGALLHAAVKRPLAQYLSEKIWAKFGMESDATWWLDSPGGLEIGGSGFSATLRDYGRFGQFVLDGGLAGGQRIVPDGWFADAGAPKNVGGHLVDYGYMWWPVRASIGSVHEGAFAAVGIFGQTIYVNQKQKIVVVVWSARSKPAGVATVSDEAFFAAVVERLKR